MGFFMPEISVIITSYNQKQVILKNLESWNYIYNNQFKDFEMIICDDGSEDGSRKAIKHYKTPYKKKLLWHEHHDRRVAKLKNMGIKASRGKYILINDGDTFPDRTTIPVFKEKIKQFQADNIAFMGVRWRFDWDKFKHKKYDFNWISECVTKNKDWRGIIQNVPPASHRHYSGANVIYPAKLLKKVLWAPDDFVGFGYDDYWHALTWLENGGVFIAVNESIAYHIDHPNTVASEINEKKLIEKEKYSSFLK